MAKAKEELEYILDEKGRKKAVILPIRKYRQLMENLHDLQVILERRDEPSIPADEVEELLRADGLIPPRS